MSDSICPRRSFFIILFAAFLVWAFLPGALSVVYPEREDPTVVTHAGVMAPAEAVPLVTVPSVDRAAVAIEDASRERQGHPPRFAIPNEVLITPETYGLWETLNRGTLVWRLRIASPGASSINLGFTRFHMPDSGKMILYAADLSHVIRPITAWDNAEHGQMWTPVILSDEIVVEVTIARHEREALLLELTTINAGYRGFEPLGDSSKTPVDCMIDVACPQGDPWRQEIASVGKVTLQGTLLFSGTMINNTAQDRTPYFLTCAHAEIDTDNDATLVVYWNYETPYCGGGTAPTDQWQGGSTLTASWHWSDFALVLLDDQPLIDWQVTYAGWDRTGDDALSGTCIHHTWALPKMISYDRNPSITELYTIRVESWNSGSVTHGASGSALWDQNKRVIGIASYTYGDCDHDLPTWYGRFSKSWEGAGTTATSLEPWLDPLGTGPMTLDTIDPGCGLDKECDDGLFCNGPEPCSGLTCRPGEDPCPCGICDEDNDLCIPFTDDEDSDGVADPCDNCVDVVNPDQTDADDDDIGDACDHCPLTPSADNTDSDSDGQGDICDNCPFTASADQSDPDSDGLGAPCDPCPLDPLDDVESDGVCGDVDNCPTHVNPDQLDEDSDGLGNACEWCPLDPLNDIDSDSQCANEDNCPFDFNPAQLDLDSDGQGDDCDPCPADPLDDGDGDGHCANLDNCPVEPNPGQEDGDLEQLSQWAVSATASSEWTATDYSATQASGPPEHSALCEDRPTAWSPLGGTDDPEWLDLEYATPVQATGVNVYEAYQAGFVYRIDLRDTGGNVHTVWSGGDTTACGGTCAPVWNPTPYWVRGAVVHTQVPDWEEIDAVELVGLGPVPDGVGNVCDNCPSLFNPDQSDLDGDGTGDLCDCAPEDPGLTAPREVRELTVEYLGAGISRLAWSPVPGADQYWITRGDAATLSPGQYGACLSASIDVTTLDDADLPGPGETFIYLVQGVSDVCGSGNLGYDTRGIERINEDPQACSQD